MTNVLVANESSPAKGETHDVVVGGGDATVGVSISL